MTKLRTYLPEDDARRETARAFDEACEASGLSNYSIGAAIGIDESFVRRMRRGTDPIPAHRVVQLPETVASTFSAGLLAANERHHTPPTAANTDAQAALLGAAASALAQEICNAFGNDSRIDEAEVVRIIERHGAVNRAGHALRVVAGSGGR